VSTPELGYGPASQLLDSGVHFTALVCYDDLAAIGAIRAFMDHGLRVPEDISVVGFDDIQGASYHNPSLTTIRQPLQQMGVVAARNPAATDSRAGNIFRYGIDYAGIGDSRVDLSAQSPARAQEAELKTRKGNRTQAVVA